MSNSDHTSFTNSLKTCKNGAQCLHPSGPHLPLSEFYQRAGAADGYYTVCKFCKRQENKRYIPKSRHIASYESEAKAIGKLRSVGIYALPGKMSEWRSIDVVAWGCVRIEIKTSQLDDSGFRFTLGYKTADRWKAHDLVMLVCLWPDDEPSYHLFTVDDPVFWKGGRIKSGVQFIPAGQHYKHRWYETMTVEKMTEHQDNWQLVEEVRQQKSTALIRCGDTWKHIA